MKVWLVLSLAVGIAGQLPAAEDVDYARDVKPLLAEKCAACHGVLKQEAGLRLDAGVLIRKGSTDGPVIVPGKSAGSLLIEKVSAEDVFVRMPPEGKGAPLNAKEIAILTRWIDAGAVVPQDEAIPEDPSRHWAYQVPERPEVPKVDDAEWSHPIDAFIAHKHHRLGLTPVGMADRHTLLRRVYLDLIGLPPTREQLQAFLEDDSPDAWTKVVDSLLESPHYGERWGRHWMDVWRYSDWDGYQQELRGSQRHIWHWRDWIVESLNADKGYDRMVVEMLAADEAAPTDTSALRATGFLARNFHKSNRNMWLDATVEHTAKAFLGMTLNCARCHDHKYDPLAQTMYYQFRAIFEPHRVRTDRVPGEADVMQDGLPRAYDAELAAETFLYLQGNEKHPDKEHPLQPDVPDVLRGTFDIQPVKLPVEAFYPALVDFVEQEQIGTAEKQLAAAQQALDEAVAQTGGENGSQASPSLQLLKRKCDAAQLRVTSITARYAADRSKFAEGDAAGRDELAKAAAAAERQFNAAQAELTVTDKESALAAAESSGEQDAKKKQTAVDAARKELDAAKKHLAAAQEALKKTDDKYTPVGETYPQTSSGRRLALARWITDRNNPLTARVAVNHIWMRHFGEPLVESVFDFGLRAGKPRHVDLLDWLAVELIEHDWSMKHLHRLIVTSRAWRLASTAGTAAETANQKIDRDNNYLWRMNVNRLDAEIIRDNVLAASGQLDPSLGGADIDYLKGEESRRRSIYLRHAYEKQMKMLVLFDAPSPNDCYRRSESIVPQQALALTNSSLSLGKSRLLALELWKEASAKESARSDFIQQAFLQILSRPPADDELQACEQFLSEQAKTLADTSKLTTYAGGDAPQVQPAADPAQRARENLIQVLMNHNDFVTVR